jgi:hypothetical protein
MAESVVQYELAAVERLLDGMSIALTEGRGSSQGSVYLFGYVIEMVLKAAFFRVIGWNAAHPVQMARIAATLGAPMKPADRHDLAVLSRALLAARIAAGLATAPAVSGEMSARAARAAGAWRVDARYDGTALPRGVVPADVR